MEIERVTGADLLALTNKLEKMLDKWRQSIGFLAQKAPKQLNIVDFKRQTPLMLVAEQGDSELVQGFLRAGANPDMQDWQGMTALHGAIKSRVNACVDILLSYPCSLEKATNDGRSPMHTAVWVANLHATQQLLRLAPELAWQKDSAGHTPLELVEFLIEKPLALKSLEEELRGNGRRCATKDELLMTARLLESEMFESPG
ncbi:MAG: ankyrin repeat domain-containing protein [Gammaproteobacteria bacterium]|nr:ankyrin repeat domain-containing protein [Gammaproteobacteria bacterium]